MDLEDAGALREEVAEAVRAAAARHAHEWRDEDVTPGQPVDVVAVSAVTVGDGRAGMHMALETRLRRQSSPCMHGSHLPPHPHRA
eukprot:155317-Chlamydomonas_euryale.AAC.1